MTTLKNISNVTSDDALRSAAPDLLEALIRALPFVEDAEGSPEFVPGYVRAVIKQVRDAIAKAEG